MALHSGLVDLYPSSTGVAGTTEPAGLFPGSILATTGINMGVLRRQHGDRSLELRAALRDERQLVRYRLRPLDAGGALNLISGQLNGVIGNINGTASVTPDGAGGLTAIGDADPLGDVCSTTTGELYSMTGEPPSATCLIPRASAGASTRRASI